MIVSGHDLCRTRFCRAERCENDAENNSLLCASCIHKSRTGRRVVIHTPPEPLEPTLRCNTCKTWKPDAAYPLFDPSTRRAGGRNPDRRGRYCVCLECEAKRRAKSRANDPEYNAKQTARRKAKRAQN